MQSYQDMKDPELAAEVYKSPVSTQQNTSIQVKLPNNEIGRLYKRVVIGLLAFIVLIFWQLFYQRNIITLQRTHIDNLRSINLALAGRYARLLSLHKFNNQQTLKHNGNLIQTSEGSSAIPVEEFLLRSKTRNGTFPMYCSVSEAAAPDFRFKLYSNLSSGFNNVTKYIQQTSESDNSPDTEIQKRICWIGPENSINGDKDFELRSKQITLPHLLRLYADNPDNVHLIADSAKDIFDPFGETGFTGTIDLWRRGIYNESEQTFVKSQSNELPSPHFKLIFNRGIEIQTKGSYTIYAQLTYRISPDTTHSIFAINVNGKPKIRCKVVRREKVLDYLDIDERIHPGSDSTAPTALHLHSCSTSLALELSTFDTVEIFCIQGCMHIVPKSDLSYWGIQRIEQEPA